MGTSAEIKIRDMTFDDVQSVCEIENQSFYYSTWTPEFFQNCLKSNRHAKLVAELDKKILAYAILEILGRNAYLLKFVVSPNFRRKTLGKNFLDVVIKLAKKWNGLIIKLHVNTKNVPAIRLYETFGFRVAERLENFYKDVNENAFVMELKI